VFTSVFLLLAVLIDKLFGEPPRFHPLVGFGRLARWVEGKLYPTDPQSESAKRLRVRGAIGLALLLVPLTLMATLFNWLPYIGWFYAILLLYLALGAKSLNQHAAAVVEALKAGDLPLARRRVGMIVSRDTSQLTEQEVSRATVESVLENGSDAVFATVFWYLVLGAPGAVLYRLVNTMDAMWGYKNDRYLHFGWAAARLDDAMNYLPARLTALTYALLGNRQDGLRCWREQAPTWYSPNAGPVMAAGAGALGVELGGAAVYHGSVKQRPPLGLGRAPEAADIERAIALVNRGLWLWVGLALLVGLPLGYFYA